MKSSAKKKEKNNSVKLEKTKFGNLENSGGRRWPKFYGFTFSPKSMGSTKAGGNIEEGLESPADALHSDFEYLADLFELACQELALRTFWSNLHKAWVFYSPEELQSLGYGNRALCEFTLRTFKKKEKFYEEILADHKAKS